MSSLITQIMDGTHRDSLIPFDIGDLFLLLHNKWVGPHWPQCLRYAFCHRGSGLE